MGMQERPIAGDVAGMAVASGGLSAFVRAATGRVTGWFAFVALWFSNQIKDLARDWATSQRNAAVVWMTEGNPDAQDLADFVRMLDGKNSTFESKIDARMEKEFDKISTYKADVLSKFDNAADKLQARHGIIFNQEFRDRLRARIVNHLDTAESRARTKIIESRQAAVAIAQTAVEKLKAQASSAVERAEVKRQEIASLRTPGLNGRSREQLKKMLKNIEEGDNRGQWSAEQLRNQLKAMELSGR